jgi:hypothetical protein
VKFLYKYFVPEKKKTILPTKVINYPHHFSSWQLFLNPLLICQTTIP